MSTAPQSTSHPVPAGIRIEFRDVEKRFGMRLALRRLSFDIEAGECVALVGHNGSGKTTLLKMAAQLSSPSSGKITYYEQGRPVASDALKRRVGMVGHSTLVYDDLTAEENLTFFAKLYALPDPSIRVAEALESVGLTDRADDLVRTFSRGMRQRMGIARALLASPGLLLLDEPAAGLDPQGQHWLGQTLERVHAAGCTVMMSTHGRNETQAAVTRAIRLEAGRVTHDSGAGGNPAEVLVMASVRDSGEES